MKTWLKQQLTETTAWAGFLMIVGSFLFPRSLFIGIGIALIAADDDIVHKFLTKISPRLGEWLDEV